MAKQNGKKTRADKEAEGAKKGSDNNKAQAKKPVEKEEKPKGPMPDFRPNHEREAERERLAFAREIVEARKCYPDMVGGISGKYLVGVNTNNETEGYAFCVKNITLPEKADRPARAHLVIEGPKMVDDKQVYVQHRWLFIPMEECYFANGPIGYMQRDMIAFLKKAMYDEILEAKRLRFEKQEAAKKVLVEKPAFSLATVDGQAVKHHQEETGSVQKSINKLTDLQHGVFGRYNFTDSQNKSCLVEHFPSHNTSALRITSMQQGHELEQSGVRVGIELFVVNLNNNRPIPESAKYQLSAEYYAHLVIVREFFIARLHNAEMRKSA